MIMELDRHERFVKAPTLDTSFSFDCWNCGVYVSPTHGLNLRHQRTNTDLGAVGLCPNCHLPTFAFDFLPWGKGQYPQGGRIQTPDGLPPDVHTAFTEAAACHQAGAYTACVMMCRKMLMHVSVDFGERPGLAFVAYVDFLANNGYISPRARAFVDVIRQQGNEANHEIAAKSHDESLQLLQFVTAILRNNYEAPSAVNPTSP